MMWVDEDWIVASMKEWMAIKSDMNGTRLDCGVNGGINDSVNGWEVHGGVKQLLFIIIV